jgi:hypothetical protein
MTGIQCPTCESWTHAEEWSKKDWLRIKKKIIRAKKLESKK